MIRAYLKTFLPFLLISITGAPRFKPVLGKDFVWLKGHWVMNAYRLWDVIFWRKAGIQPFSAAISYTEDGEHRTHYKFYKWEALFAYIEANIRVALRFRLPKFRFVPLPVLATPQGLNLPSIFNFAIALDTSGGHTTSGPTSTDTISSLVVSSSNPVIVAFPQLNSGNDNIASCAFNAVNLTQIIKLSAGAGGLGEMYAYFITGQSGTHNLVTTQNTDTNAMRTVAITYTGVNQSMTYTGTPTDSATTNTATGTSISCTQTPTTANSWFVTALGDGDTTNGAASTNVTERVTAGSGQEYFKAGDSNGVVSGSTTQTWTSSTSDNLAMIQVSVSPISTTSIKTWNGLAKASVKTINGLAIASVKTINGLA